MGGLILAAPSSGAGKTTITLGILRALARTGQNIRSAKSGPDYIDPQFHAAATGRPCVNLDAWAMTPERLKSLASGEGDLIVEGAMGLFDGAPPLGKGSTADLSKTLNLPVVLIVDAKSMSQSVAALVGGFTAHDKQVKVVGVILNHVGSERHADMLKTALAPLKIPVLGAIPRSAELSRPSRHLGLVQAGEMPDLESFLNLAADIVAKHVDLCSFKALMSRSDWPATSAEKAPTLRVAVAKDEAFSFTYPHLIRDWEQSGVTILPFSPLANEPVPEADRVYLPGGYPELYAATLAQNKTFMQSINSAAQSIEIYGECGGFMTLGENLIDADGTSHKMAGLLGLTTSFRDRKLHLGYRTLTQLAPHPLTQHMSPTITFAAHEFHYASTLSAEGTPLFNATNAEGTALEPMGLIEGRVAGSFAHIIDPI
ncbi:cobyrinate a,c-diamide synthase [Octadecabacter ascidiaceicola]|uniref:cobyrinate a,c-diamide synthase n=1 Tax=Octadecabacter ascidiaceicola TaxID=1655543 RepID=UPI000B8AACD3|nr:cobyrinate a,c-diamide synthase [Octadecabacter ascidiaceicola]